MFFREFFVINKLKLCLFCIALMFGLHSYAQSNQNIVILWDVSGSLLPNKTGTKDFDGSLLQTYSHGNGLWVELKKSIIECIEYVEEDPSNKITIVTFNDAIRDIFSQCASVEGKEILIDKVKNYKYKGHKYTNIVEPINKFYNLLNVEDINYMFLFTDGDNDQPSTKAQLIPTLDSWEETTAGYNAYGFYVLVHPDADKANIRKSVESQDNFWIVPDAKVRIKICSLSPSVKYNLRDEKGPKMLPIEGNYAGVKGEVELISDDQYYNVICSDNAIANGKISIQIIPKSGKALPENHTVLVSPKIANGDQYTFIGPTQVKLEVSNIPERSLNLTIDDKDFGKATHYKSFGKISKEKFTNAMSNIEIDFSEQAKLENSIAIIKVSLVDKRGELEMSPKSQNIIIHINGEELDEDGTYILTPDMTSLSLSITGTDKTESSQYYGRIELIPSKLDNCTINGISDTFKWHFKFDRKLNPWMLALIWLTIILASYVLLRMVVIRPIKYPKFGAIQKTIIVPGMAPLIVKFKGARMVVISASPQKKQSAWDCFWNGKIIYKIHPAFTTPICLKPSRGKRILAKSQNGAYQIHPNPIPGIGSASIDIIQTKQHITIN